MVAAVFVLVGDVVGQPPASMGVPIELVRKPRPHRSHRTMRLLAALAPATARSPCRHIPLRCQWLAAYAPDQLAVAQQLRAV